MGKIQHTPGPWVSDSGYILDEQGNYLVEEISSDEEDLFIEDYEQRAANMKLMAAAPELLEALILVSQQSRTESLPAHVVFKMMEAVRSAT